MSVAKPSKRYRSFTSKSTSDEKIEAITFDLLSESFEARPRLQGAVILEFLSVIDDGSSASAAQLLTLIKAALVEESWTRFDALIHNPDTIVEIETIGEIVSFLVEEYTSRPTKAS